MPKSACGLAMSAWNGAKQLNGGTIRTPGGFTEQGRVNLGSHIPQGEKGDKQNCHRTICASCAEAGVQLI